MILRPVARRIVTPACTASASTSTTAASFSTTNHPRRPESEPPRDFDSSLQDAASPPPSSQESIFVRRTRVVAEREALQTQIRDLRHKIDVANTKQAFRLQKHNKKALHKLGSDVSPVYKPHELITKPTTAADITLELLLASQTHMGHATSLWNPANQRYIEGIRQGIHIISLEVTAAHLRRAAKIVEGVCYHGGLVLFIGTRPGHDRAVIAAAANAKGCHLFQRWIPGTITNSAEILLSSKQVAVDEMDRIIESPVYERKVTDFRKLRPDLVIVLNPLENYLALRECSQYNIPTIGVIDTDADPTWVTYPIPANDDSLRAINLIAGVLGTAGKSGQVKRLEAAKTGKVTWDTQTTLKEWAKMDEAWMKKLKDEQTETREKAETEAAARAQNGSADLFATRNGGGDRAVV